MFFFFLFIAAQFFTTPFAKAYGTKLISSTHIDVIGKIWHVIYDPERRYLGNLREMLKYFKVESKEILVFKFDWSDIISVRIFQKDGKEIDYIGRMIGTVERGSPTLMWNTKRKENGINLYFILNYILLHEMQTW